MQIARLRIMTEEELPPFVEYALRELETFCRESPGIPVERGEKLMVEPGVTSVLVGRSVVERYADDLLLPVLGLNADLGEEGFVLRACPQAEPPVIVAAGWHDAGTRHAVLEFCKQLEVTADPPVVADDLALREIPDHELRGMYSHQHWAYNYPYALRSWKVEDWKRYADILAYFRVNLWQIWSMASMLPVPLSEGDREYLEQYPEAVEHAKRNHNMEVWIGECANNMAEDRDAPSIAERLYFDVEVLKDPSDPAQMNELFEARKVFYSTCSNADGYWNLDSDPGGWKGSPASEYVDILARNRELIDECTQKGREAKLIYWMWCGWGTGEPEENWRDTVREMMERIQEPWWLTVAWKGHWDVVEELGLLEKTVFYPYGAIEPEPSLPFTLVIPRNLTESLGMARERVGTIRGAMGNAQTPLVQLPNIHAFTRAVWDTKHVGPPKEESLRELARMLFPEHADLLTRGWLSLGDPEAPEGRELADRMEKIADSKDLGRPGPVGLKVFPGGEILFADLAVMLRIHAAAREFVRKTGENASDDELVDLVNEYNLLSVQWRKRNGFRRFPNNGYDFFPLRDAAQERWMEDREFRKDIEQRLFAALEKEHGAAEAEFNLRPLLTWVEKKK
jgi:hypothetical protein